MTRSMSMTIATLTLVAGACAGGSRAAETTMPSPSSTTTATTATTTTTTTTTLPPTTTTTAPPTPEELRQAFVEGLDLDGWILYTDSAVGWSIRYPSDWTILDEEPGESLVLTPGDGAIFIVGIARDASVGTAGSLDYLNANIEVAVDDGLLRPPPEDNSFWLDLDFDEERDVLDIEGVETWFAIDPTTGETLADDLLAPVWWYGYYDPDVRPDYGFIFQTIGLSPTMFQYVDDVVLSFEPPG